MMKALTLNGDQWKGADLLEWEIKAASVADFDHALDRLDASSFTMVTLKGDAEEHLAIAGGAGQYVVYATSDNLDFFNLVRPGPATGVIMLNCGGQVGDYPAAQVVGIDQARAAGHAFLAGVLLDPGQSWIEG